MKKEFLECGKIVTTHGVKGELKVLPWCDSSEFLCDFDTLYLDDRGGEPLEVLGARPNKNMLLLRVRGVDSMEKAEALRGKILYIKRADAKLEEGDFFIQDLMGLQVVSADDPALSYGVLTQVSQTGANDVYHIQTPEGKEVLIPAIKEVVVSVELDGGTMAIRPLKGLFDDED